MTTLKLKKFDISSIKHDNVVVLLGKRRTGKSFLVKDLLYYQQNLPLGTVISGTEGANKFYGDIIPSMFIHEHCTPELLDNVVKRQKKCIKKINKEKEKFGRSNIDPRAFLILDDCLFDKSWPNNQNIRELFMNGRHYKVFFVVTMQYPMGIPPVLRSNVDYVFILRENNTGNRRRIYEQYAGVFPNFDVFNQTMDACTQDYECLVIDNTTPSTRMEDTVFWYKAPDHDNFRIGAREFWINNENSDDEDTDEEDLMDINSFRKSKNMIKVKKTGMGKSKNYY